MTLHHKNGIPDCGRCLAAPATHERSLFHVSALRVSVRIATWLSENAVWIATAVALYFAVRSAW